MDPSIQQQQYYYAPSAAPPAYYPPQTATAGADAAAGYVLPMQPGAPPHTQMVYYTAPAAGAPPGYAYPTPMYYQPPEAAFAAMSLSGQTMLQQQQHQQQQMPQPQQTPGASSTTSNGSSSQPRASSTPIPADEPASLAAPAACNGTMIPMHVVYTQVPQYYQPMTYEAGAPQGMVPMLYPQDPSMGQMIAQQMQPAMQQHHAQSMQQHQQVMHQQINRMMSTDPEVIPESIDDISQISHHSSPDSFIDVNGQQQQRVSTTPLSSIRRRVSLPPTNQGGHTHNLMPSNYKTRMCTQWLEKRECSMGNACKFAHGNSELRLPERPFRAINNPKYKTKMCKNFEPGASGLCAYAERCEYIHPTDREYIAYKARMETMARARGDFTRCKNMFDEKMQVPSVRGRGGRGGAAGHVDEEDKSVRSADSSCDHGSGASPPTLQQQAAAVAAAGARGRRPGERRGMDSYLGSGMPPSMTRSAIRMGASGEVGSMRRGFAGGSMYNLASGAYTERDEYRSRLDRVPSASNVASMGVSSRTRYGGQPAPPPTASAAKLMRRSSMCHLNTVEY